METKNFYFGKKVLVTGAAGFKASYLCAVLYSLGAEVYGTVRNRIPQESVFNMLELHNKINVITGFDINNCGFVKEVLNKVKPDVVFHIAACSVVTEALRNPFQCYQTNIMGTLNVLEAMRELGLTDSNLLITSTDHVFGSVDAAGIPEKGFPENTPVNYGAIYDTSKSAMEMMVRSYNVSYGNQLPKIVITRSANVFGLGDPCQRRILPAFIKTALLEKQINLTCRKNGRQYISIRDVINGYLLAICYLGRLNANDLSIRSNTPTFHFSLDEYGTKNCYLEVEAVAHIISGNTGAKIIEMPDCVDYMKNENKTQALNCQISQSTLGWKPRVSFETAINDMIDFYRHNGNTSIKKGLIEEEVEFIKKLFIENE